jgi:hypothetical protein
MPEIINRTTVQHTIKLDPDANAHLVRMVPTKTGAGGFISRLLLEHKLRIELAEQYRLLATKEQ